MKKINLYILCVILIFIISSCGKDDLKESYIEYDFKADLNFEKPKDEEDYKEEHKHELLIHNKRWSNGKSVLIETYFPIDKNRIYYNMDQNALLHSWEKDKKEGKKKQYKREDLVNVKKSFLFLNQEDIKYRLSKKELESVGKGKVLNYECEIYEDKNENKKIWFSEELNTMLKFEHLDIGPDVKAKVKLIAKKIELKKIDSKIFDIPSDIKFKESD